MMAMPLIPDYQSRDATRSERHDAACSERGAQSTSATEWVTALGFLASLGALGKALLASGGMLADEKPIIVVLLVIATALNSIALVMITKKPNASGLMASAMALGMLAGGFYFAAVGWK